MLVHLHLVDDVGSHLQTVLQLVEGREEHFLDNLEIAEIAYWQVVHDEHYLLWKALELVALGAFLFVKKNGLGGICHLNSFLFKSFFYL